MRIYTTLEQARSELMRDLKEMGIPIATKSYQNKPVKGHDLETVELMHYNYMITQASSIVPRPEHAEWAEEEWLERISTQTMNPGNAWMKRRDYWHQFLNRFGMFDYTYNTRMECQLDYAIDLLRKDPMSRRACISIWSNYENFSDLDIRVPCSMYYHFMIRDKHMYVDYHQRSCDLIEHWRNDLYFAMRMGNHIAKSLGMHDPNKLRVIHRVGSLHAYNKDLEGVF